MSILLSIKCETKTSNALRRRKKLCIQYIHKQKQMTRLFIVFIQCFFRLHVSRTHHKTHIILKQTYLKLLIPRNLWLPWHCVTKIWSYQQHSFFLSIVDDLNKKPTASRNVQDGKKEMKHKNIWIIDTLLITARRNQLVTIFTVYDVCYLH